MDADDLFWLAAKMNDSDTGCCKKFFKAIRHYAFIVSGFIANDKFTSMVFMALNEAEEVAAEWDTSDGKKSIKAIRAIEKTLSAFLVFNSFTYTLVQKHAAEIQVSWRDELHSQIPHVAFEDIELDEIVPE